MAPKLLDGVGCRRLALRAGGGWLLGAALSARAAGSAAPADDVCHTPPPADGLQRSSSAITLPPVRLRRHDGATVTLPATVSDEQPVLLNFLFTSCTTICPPMAQIFAATQEQLGARRTQLQMLSISIDPLVDHPARLREYAARFDAGPQWRFHTGSPEAIDAVQRAFNVWRPDKMGHTPVTFVRARGAKLWVRLDGFATPTQLIREAFAGA
ncbi:MAG TPA: SCO family protein [Burkholderiaceae bacterium]|nr:SCO family protein [Burkholderiaceae bacterium]HMX09723.1 SCO family protein [Burkholderiaceae bacterium]HMZ00669.1 SCO family protein [Burkholderiaceae bacterium]HNB43894.1 SCO family protein [Burkholderiaceae bacterium]HNG80454.1 SCO family protein [Burkholderiaceae bacterium]